MQDEINEKTVSLCVRGGKISARILSHALKETLARMERGKTMARGRESAEIKYHGKQSMGKLKSQGHELSSVEVTDENIKSFEKCARKYSVDYCLKKDRSAEPPKYYVFFKARDVDSMTAAFKEYTGWQTRENKKPSIRKRLSRAKECVAKHREREKAKSKERDAVR